MQAALDAAVVLVDRGLGHVGLGLAETAQIGAHDAVTRIAEVIGEPRHGAERARARQRPVGRDHDRGARATARLVGGADDLGAVAGAHDERAPDHARAQASAAASNAGSSTVTRA